MLKKITVDKINKLSRTNEIWCIGCGKRFNELLSIYTDEEFVSKITSLIDNNEKLWGIKKKVKDKFITICSKEKIKEIKKNKSIILITSDHANAIYDSIKSMLNNEIQCYLYPDYYYKYTRAMVSCVKFLPLKRRMLFYAGNEPHENADELVRYLKEEYSGKKYQIVFLDKCNMNKDGICYIDKFTLRKKTSFFEQLKYIHVYACSKYLLYENEPLKKMRKEQTLIFMNHGTLPLKNVSDVLQQPNELDLAICPWKDGANTYLNQYGIPINKQLNIMPPRVNYMMKCKGKIHELVGNLEKQVVLWLPTFRQLYGSDRIDSKNKNPIELLESNIQKINQILEGNNQILVIKQHPREKEKISISPEYKNIKIIYESNLEEYAICTHDLMKDADALITDYSSIAFEYMLLDKPIGYVISDMDSYYRGFSVDNPLEYMPGDKIISIDEMEKFLNDLKNNSDKYRDERNLLIEKIFGETAYVNGAEALVNFLNNRR